MQLENKLSTGQKKTLLCIFLGAFLLRVIFIFSYHNYDDIEKMKINGEEMIEIASHIVQGNGFSGKFILDTRVKPTAVMAPFYPYFLAFILQVFGKYGYLTVQLIQAVISSLICIIIYLTGLKIFDKKIAFIASILAALYLPLIYYCTVIWGAIFFAFLVTLYIYYLLRLQSDYNKYNLCFCGFILGIALLIDPVIVSFIPLSVLWLLFSLKTYIKISFKKVIMMLGITLVVITPWTIRNYILFNKFVFIKSQAGFTLWLGNNPHASGTERLVNDDSTEYKLPEEEYQYLTNLDESERDRYFLLKALAFIKENREKSIELFLKKFKSFWWVIEKKTTGFSENTKIAVMKITYGIPFVLALVGLLLSIKQIKSYMLIIFLFISLSFIYSITVFPVYRYRLPVEPYLLLFSSVSLSQLLQNIFTKAGAEAKT